MWVSGAYVTGLEARVRELEAELKAERERNREREDFLQSQYFAGRNALLDSAAEKYLALAEQHARHVDSVLNRWLTVKAGAYAVEERGAAPEGEKSEPKSRFTPEQLEERDFYIESAKEHGLHESKGVEAFEAHMRGEPLPFEMVEQ
jgi:hypothetical protein